MCRRKEKGGTHLSRTYLKTLSGRPVIPICRINPCSFSLSSAGMVSLTTCTDSGMVCKREIYTVFSFFLFLLSRDKIIHAKNKKINTDEDDAMRYKIPHRAKYHTEPNKWEIYRKQNRRDLKESNLNLYSLTPPTWSNDPNSISWACTKSK
jgi:hypothetical protein